MWDALINPVLIEKWSGSKAMMSEVTSSQFKLWNGDIFGKNVEVVKNAKIVQEWQEKEWDKPSKVTFTLKEKDGKTEVTLLHENVPDESFKDIDNGWGEYYLGPLKELVEGLT